MMSDKKNIDRLFQEKFKDFETFPDPVVWKNIERKLQKKRKKRIVPLWFKIGSAAAILLLMITTGVWYFDSNKNTTEPNEIIISNSDTDDVLDKNSNGIKPEEIEKAQTNVANQKNNVDSESNTDKIKKRNDEITPSFKLKQTLEQSPLLKEETTVIANNSSIKKSSTTVENAIDQKVDALVKEEETLIASGPISKEENTPGKKDLIEEINKPKEVETITDVNTSKWSIGSSVSPLYFNTLSEGSPIDGSLSSNSKSDDGSLSFGVKVNYKISKKLSIQSGINSVQLGYTTENVTALISSSLLDESTTNINTNIEGVSVAAISTTPVVETSAAFSQRATNDLSGNLDQTLNYIEIPIEAKYNISQRKIGINLVGGVSTYFLRKNEVSITSFGKTTTLGEASNLNTTNFSGNLGLDLDYNIGKNLYINVTPMFKYQFNTFSDNSGGFKPYYLGVYTGLNFRF